ncbi:helix-turn-helix transcriptional regulator [Sphingobacterium arenae]|uniref:LuxR family transcriptional regulator n=1 Tax=Sphingobacterium arenae TaxID=1280598 RepID=A0ABR7XYD4_9SPHI|nr:LuxR family transcriptional regulator [Sphingobacterium arenae]MBD1424061.1 LuxR family transcriptional regulator [Sphingobacterium arenae]
MNVFGTEMHIITFLFSSLETLMFIFLLPGYLSRPDDKPRFWYLILLLLLILYNVTGGLLPNTEYPIPVYVQNIIAYGSGFLVASYFPFYFYTAFNLKLLRFHALYGVPLFLLLPYLLFFVISYSIHEDLNFTIQYGIIVPFFYSIVLLWAILRAIRVAYKENRQKNYYVEEIAVYAAVAPWALMTVIAYFEFSQLTEALFTNLGFLAVTGMFIFKSVRQDRNAISRLRYISTNGIRPEQFMENCIRFQFTPRETEVITLLHKGYNTGEIAERLHIAERTVTTHIQNMMAKTDTHSRLELLRKLEFGIFEV